MSIEKKKNDFISFFFFMISFSEKPLFDPLTTTSSVFSTSIACDNSLAVAGLSTGSIQLFSTKTGRLSYYLYPTTEEYPIMSVRFVPNDPKHFLAASAGGQISLYSLQQQPEKVYTLNEYPNEIYAMEINNLGNRFAVGGRDRIIKVYDVKTAEIQRRLFKRMNYEASNGHINRINALHYNKFNSHMLISGGWDDTLQFWDLRMNESIHTILGPHCFSDSIDVYDHTLVAGSLRIQNQIQLFDLRMFTQIANVKWPTETENDHQSIVYACKFDPSGEYFFVGGSGDTTIRAFSTKTMQAIKPEIKSKSTVYTISFSPDKSYFIYGNDQGAFTHPMAYQEA